MNNNLIRILNKHLLHFLLIALSLTPLVWFYGKKDILINGVDTNFPLNPLVWLGRRLFVWNSLSNTGGDFSSSTAGLFFHSIQAFPYLFKMNLQTVEIFSLIFWFSGIVFAAYLLSRKLLPKDKLAQITFVVLYSFNIYLFNTWENVKVANLSLMVSLPLFLTIIISSIKAQISFRQAIFYSALSSIVVSGAGINPAYIIALLLGLTLYAAVAFLSASNMEVKKRIVQVWGLILLIIMAVNSYWILPTLDSLFGSGNSIRNLSDIGFTDWLKSLSVNTSLLNVLRMQGAWDWYVINGATQEPIYIPYALNYLYKTPFIAFSFLFFALSLISYLVKQKGRNLVYYILGLFLILGIFLGSGAHEPTGILYLFLAKHVPFFSFFRSPWYIFTVFLILAFSGLISLLVFNLNQKISAPHFWLKKIVVTILIIIFLLGNLVYTYPLITGKIFRPNRLDSFFIKFPSYVFSAGDWLNTQDQFDSRGRIISYPDDETEKFKWGYRGLESVIGLMSKRELLFRPMNSSQPELTSLIDELYNSLKKNQLEFAQNLAAKLNANLILEKLDQDSLALPLSSEIKLWEKINFGEWNFYQIPAKSYLPKIYSTDQFYYAYPFQDNIKSLGLVDKNAIIVNPADSVFLGLDRLSGMHGNIIIANNNHYQDYLEYQKNPHDLIKQLQIPEISKVVFTFDTLEGGNYEPVLERYHLEEFGLDLTRDFVVEVDGSKTTWKISKISDSFVYFNKIDLDPGSHKAIIILSNQNLIHGGNFENEAVFQKNGGAIFDIEKGSEGKYLSILNKSNKYSTASFPVDSFDPMAIYHVQFRYKLFYGHDGAVFVNQANNKVLIQTTGERLPSYPEWHDFNVYYSPVKTSSSINVSLAANIAIDPFGSRIYFDDLAVHKVFTNQLMLLQKNEQQVLSQPEIKFKQISPVEYEAEIKATDKPYMVIFSENYSPKWHLKITNSKGEVLDNNIPHFSANLYANGWFIDKVGQDHLLKIYYQPQDYFNLGLGISVITLFLALMNFLLPFFASLIRRYR